MSNHDEHAIEAKEIYKKQFDSEASKTAWHVNLRLARSAVADALRASNYLLNISDALQNDGGHMLVFRHLLAPPTSQDQFALLVSDWSKGSESNRRPIAKDKADLLANTLYEWLDPGIASWVLSKRKPTVREVRELLERASSLIAAARHATNRRSQLASDQEGAVIEVLDRLGWTKMENKLVEQHASLGDRQYMHKTRFATKTRPQEVDVACGLGSTIVLAIECKVTNDETNSVKRINDILKKATAWKDHWGNFVITAAVLQGVIKPSDVQRLIDHEVEVFWSHRLGEFEEWLNNHRK